MKKLIKIIFLKLKLELINLGRSIMSSNKIIQKDANNEHFYNLKQILYIREGDKNRENQDYISNCLILNNGNIIAARKDNIVNIDYLGNESILLNIPGASDWRGMFLDNLGNVFVSPFDSVSGKISPEDRGLYKLEKNSFNRVLSLYDGEIDNMDCIWTLTQDRDGFLYAGNYSHTNQKIPIIYKSIDGGNNWFKQFNFLEINKQFRHIHCIYYDKFNNNLYAILGDVNIKSHFLSVDGGANWKPILPLMSKNTAIISTSKYRILGSDDIYHCSIYLTQDDKHWKIVYDGWYRNIFAFRISDKSNWIYAFTKLDPIVDSLDYFPPIEAINNNDVLKKWIKSGPIGLKKWKKYNKKYQTKFPEDAIRPNHIGILCSKDGGITWEDIYIEQINKLACGFWLASNMVDGQVLGGITRPNEFGNGRKWGRPIIINEDLNDTVLTRI